MWNSYLEGQPPNKEAFTRSIDHSLVVVSASSGLDWLIDPVNTLVKPVLVDVGNSNCVSDTQFTQFSIGA